MNEFKHLVGKVIKEIKYNELVPYELDNVTIEFTDGTVLKVEAEIENIGGYYERLTVEEK